MVNFSFNNTLAQMKNVCMQFSILSPELNKLKYLQPTYTH